MIIYQIIIKMRTKSVGKKKINVVTLGCSKNVYDSEVLMGQLKPVAKMWFMKKKETWWLSTHADL